MTTKYVNLTDLHLKNEQNKNKEFWSNKEWL